MIRPLTAATPVPRQTPGGGGEGLSAGCVLVVWPTDRDRTVTVKLSADLPVQVIDLMGNRRTMTPTGGKLAIPMQAETPVFLLLEK